MRKSIVSVVLVSIFLLSTSGVYSQNKTVTASKNYTMRTASLDNFHSIQLKGSPSVVYTQSTGKPSIEIYGPDNIIPLIEAFTKNGTLVVKYQDNINVQNVSNLKISVKGPALQKAMTNGSGSISFPEGMSTKDKLTLNTNSSGSISGTSLEAGSLEISTKGSGSVSFKNGITVKNEANLNTNSSGSISGSRLMVGSYLELSTKGSGSINFSQGITAKNLAKVNTYSSGGIRANSIEAGSLELSCKGSGSINFSDGMSSKGGLTVNTYSSGGINGSNIESSSLELATRGSGSIKLNNVTTSDVSASTASSGGIQLSGKGRNASYKTSGSGSINAADFEVENAEAHTKSSGSVRCYATKKLSGSANGSGGVKYKGNPEISFSHKGLSKL